MQRERHRQDFQIEQLDIRKTICKTGKGLKQIAKENEVSPPLEAAKTKVETLLSAKGIADS